MQTPLVSIIVPVYNVEKYIERCFNSVEAQTYKNLECIFVDDCSPDNSRDIIDYLCKDSYKFIIVSHKENLGLSAARNTGIRRASGKYIFFLDSDDAITPNCIENLVATLRIYHNSEIIQGNVRQIPEIHNDWYDISNAQFPENCEDALNIKKMFFSFPRIPVNAWGKLIFKEFITKNNLFFMENIVNEDEEWSFRAAKYITNISFTKEICYLHFINADSIMQAGDLSGRIESRLMIFDNMLKNLDEDILVLQIKFVDSLMQTLLCDIKSDARYDRFKGRYDKIYAEIKLLKRQYPLSRVPNKLFVRMKIKQILGSSISRLIIKIIHKTR